MPKPTYKQQAEEIRILKAKIAELEQSNKNERDGEQIYRALFEHAGFSISIRDPESHKFLIFNKTEYESLGYSKDGFEKLLDEEGVLDSVEKRRKHRNIVNEKGSHFFETRHRAKNGDIRYRLMSSVAVTINGKIYHLNIASDITEMKEVERALKGARDELEERVKRRTEELQRKTIELMETNTALKVLIQKRDEAMEDIEERLLENTKQLVIPHLENLKKTSLNERQRVSLIELELNLRDILSPFLKRLSNQYHSLTPSEIKIAALIREGKTSKEIADLLSVTIKTIEVHRDHLRKKLGIKYKKTNLQSHLRSFDTP